MHFKEGRILDYFTELSLLEATGAVCYSIIETCSDVHSDSLGEGGGCAVVGRSTVT